MNTFKKLPLAAAIAVALGGVAAYADEGGPTPHGKRSDIVIDKTVGVDYNLSYSGHIYTLGLVLVDSTASAFSEVNQSTHDNKLSTLVIDPNTGAVLSTPGSLNDTNNATLSGNVLSDGTGNAGVNVAAGSNNVQQNSVAIAEGNSPLSSQKIKIDLSDSQDHVDNNSGTWTWAQHAAASADASHSKSFDQTANSSSSAGLNTHLDVDKDVNVKTPDGNYSVSSVVGGVVAGDVKGDIGGDVPNSQGGLNSISGEGKGVVGGLLGVKSGTIDYGVAGADSQGQAYHESESQSAHIEGSDNYTENGNWQHVDESHYALNASVDINLLFGGSADAETFSDQTSYNNQNPSSGTNTAWLGDSVGSGFAGNIAVNVAAGNNNGQANQLALASNSGVMALATASSSQSVHDNLSVGQGSTKDASMDVTLKGTAKGGYSGYSDQLGNDYLDTWSGPLPHPSGDNTGHVDVDNETQNAGDVVYDANGNVVNEKGQAGPGQTALAPGGTFVFKEKGTVDLGDVELSGKIPVIQVVPNAVVNNATLTGDAFSNASGINTVIQNSGSNVLIQNAMIVTVDFAGGPQ